MRLEVEQARASQEHGRKAVVEAVAAVETAAAAAVTEIAEEGTAAAAVTEIAAAAAAAATVHFSGPVWSEDFMDLCG